ncbi:DapH/DapD/GlmU-related protein [Pseudomonas helvetica]|uniref:DapH/DapD/GlmU-related protein n=1 Tax=Pseudomonas helvetica TaxID=3136738 RepID=UPI003264F8E6
MKFFKHAFKYVLIHIARSWLAPPQLRTICLSLVGHKFAHRNSVFIGADVLFDNPSGARTHVGKNVTITSGVKIMNHFLEPGGKNQNYTIGDVFLEDGVFLGMNVLIVRPVRIGRGSVVAAGAVVVNDVPDNVVVGGIPAKVIRVIHES